MRRRDKEIIDKNEIDEILTTVVTGRLGTCSHEIPYITPMNFVYDKDARKIYLHCAHEGKKIENIHKNKNVCFEVEEIKDVIIKQPSCASSVILFGIIKTLTDVHTKNNALQKLVEKYAPQNPKTPFSDAMLRKTNVLEIEIKEMTAKRSPARPVFTYPSKK